MSTLRANTIQDAAGGNTMPVADINQGRAKAWFNLNGTGTIAARDSFNCSSFVDNGTGDYTANWTVSFLNSDFTLLGSGFQNLPSAIVSVAQNAVGGLTTSSARIICAQTTTAIDCANAYAAAFGDRP